MQPSKSICAALHLSFKIFFLPFDVDSEEIPLQLEIAQSAGAVEYADCISAEGSDPPPPEYQEYDTKPSEIWGMWSTPSLLLLPGPFYFRVVVTDGIPSMG